MPRFITQGLVTLLPGVIAGKFVKLGKASEQADTFYGRRLLEETGQISQNNLEADEGNPYRQEVIRYRERLAIPEETRIRRAQLTTLGYGTLFEVVGYFPLVVYGLESLRDERTLSLWAAGGISIGIRVAVNGIINLANEIQERTLRELKGQEKI